MACRNRKIALTTIFVAWVHAQTVADVPIVVAPSGEWNGLDGPWSTFNLGVGKPFQAFQGIPGLNSPAFILPVETELCKLNSCPGRTTFDRNSSSTWQDTGIYSLPLPDFISKTMAIGNATLGALWGKDAVYLGNSARDVPSDIFVILTSLPSFTTGIFGLSAGEVGVSGFTVPSLLTSLRQEAKAIPSLSFSYTAGSVSPQGDSYGSLILGGYDASRFDPSTMISIQMPSSMNNTLFVSVDSISFSGSQAVWKAGATFYIDSTLPQIWLPIEACAVFETTFGLVWNKTAELYLLDDAKHSSLQSSNETVNFTVREGATRTVSYSLPYAAFDLTASNPFGNGTSSRYFPLKRASNPSQYVLGRAFLQETYIVVDYERATFNLSQAYPEGGSTRIIAIPALNNSTSNTTSSNPGSSDGNLDSTAQRSSTLSTGASAGIGVGVAVLVLIAIGFIVAWKKRWGFFRTEQIRQEQGQIEKAELDGNAKPWVEVPAKEKTELPAPKASQEVAGSQAPVPELEGNNVVHELSANHDTH
ncbi:acid protease [Macroventuria anomochaeta]|uniref:Acid protease n=1 Tax=Macroventuria anomochaeta TaxID=301207 RepID=A0ACB6RV14_9PLEO|nr:acid protease [Macroventuria anomochaeta]KAF2625766.1 acid protease [Macroventuria anomochaeta]